MNALEYPETPKSDVQDDYHGTLVADPYRWLEDADSEETQAWVAAQNELTRSYLDSVPARDGIEQRLRALWDFPKFTPPRQRGGRYFYQKNEGLQNQPVLTYRESLDEEPKVLVDPNELSPDGTVALINFVPSEDGALLAYSLSESGSDWQTIHILDVESGDEYEEVIRWVKFTSVAWKHDKSGFYYSRYPDPESMPDAPPSTHQRVYWHRLGTAQEEDVLVYARPDAPDLAFDPFITDDGRVLVLHVWHGTDVRNRIYYRPLDSDSPAPDADEGGFVRLLDEGEARYDFAGSVGDRFYFHTDLNAPRGRVMAIDLANPAPDAWEEIVPQSEDVIDRVTMVNNKLVVVTMAHAAHNVILYERDGAQVGTIPLPDLGSIADITGRRQHRELFLHFQSFLYPPGIFRYDFESDELEPLFTAQLEFEATAYETQQVFYRSDDGTEVPMFLVHKKGLAQDGKRPTVLYGYGGFAVNMLPTFAVSWLVWLLDAGGMVAVANLRGGNEYGEEWHRAGMLEKKQNVFDDFIAAAEWLIDNDYTSRERLGIMGGSNGGLLAAACMLQRPELFGAVACRVPVADMLRYHRFTAGRYWIPEYGNAQEDAEHFRFLYAYSPLHNVREGVDYPPILIATADTDDRVVPLHGKKLAATLQAAGGRNPVLLRVETKAGHGLGKPTTKSIEELADIFAFLWRELGVGEDDG